MKVRIVQRPSGLLNGRDWPEVGEEMELADQVAKDMIKSGQVEAVAEKASDKAEKRPAAKATETRDKK